MTVDTDHTIETGRTWRDLPESPPEGDPLAPHHADTIQLPGAPPPRRRMWPWATGAAAFFVALLLMLVWSPWNDDAAEATNTETGTTEAPAPSDGELPPTSPSDEPVADVTEALLPSVVQIEAGGGVGSGFVYDEGGLVLTAAHVVQGASEVTVRLNDGRAVAGTVVGADSARDVAVVAVAADGLVAAPLALDEPVRVGQTAIAIGSPYGFEFSVTAGIVSGVDKALNVGGRSIEGLIQTDAAINQGNSGGPLANGDGEVIGINIAIATASGGSDGIGFAVPIADAIAVADTFEGNGGELGPQSAPEATPVPTDPLGDLFGGENPFGDLFGGQNPFGDLFGGENPFGDLFGVDPFGGQDPFSFDLDQLLEDLLGDVPLDDPLSLLDDLGSGLGGLVPGTGNESELFSVPDLPDGYTATATAVTGNEGGTVQVTTLSGSDGSVTIRGTAGSAAAGVVDSAQGGESATVDGNPATVTENGSRIAVVWMEGDVALEVIAPAAVGRATALEIAALVEVAA